jgi:oligopeptide/dipeptide ABC transporter ATP-binding protein
VNAATPVPATPLLVVDGLVKRFAASHDLLGRTRTHVSAVEDVSFSLARGETLAIVGESGSGKSTLARLLVRLTPATAGRITFDGIDVPAARGRDSLALHQRIQIVFQDPYASLDPRFAVGRLVGEGLYHSRMDRAARRKRTIELLEQVGLSASLIDNLPHQLSGGQRQRVGIARALAADPDLLIADEPVSALDGSIQGQVLNVLRALRADRTLAMVFITHDLSVARYMADRIAVMHLGKLVETAPTEQLFARPAHPYTRALLSAIPRYGRRDGTRTILPGDAPSPIDPPPGCRFAGRCAWRTERCDRDDPALVPEVSPEHSVACHNWRLIDVDAVASVPRA